MYYNYQSSNLTWGSRSHHSCRTCLPWSPSRPQSLPSPPRAQRRRRTSRMRGAGSRDRPAARESVDTSGWRTRPRTPRCPRCRHCSTRSWSPRWSWSWWSWWSLWLWWWSSGRSGQWCPRLFSGGSHHLCSAPRDCSWCRGSLRG